MSLPPHNTLLFMQLFIHIFRNFNYLFYGLCFSRFILKELGQSLSFSVKSKVLTRGEFPHIYNKTYKYRSLLHKLICKLCIFFTNENVKKLKVLFAFLSNQKIGGQLGFLPLSFFLKIFQLKLWESHLKNYEKGNFCIWFCLLSCRKGGWLKSSNLLEKCWSSTLLWECHGAVQQWPQGIVCIVLAGDCLHLGLCGFLGSWLLLVFWLWLVYPARYQKIQMTH